MLEMWQDRSQKEFYVCKTETNSPSSKFPVILKSQ